MSDQQEAMAQIVQRGMMAVREWAARTRPTLSDPPEGQEWRVYIEPFAVDDLDPDTGELQMRYEWVLVDVESAS